MEVALVDSAVEAAVKISGWMTDVELRWLAFCAAGKGVVVELGTWQGRSAKAMAATVGGRLFCVDPWYDHREGEYPELGSGKDNTFLKFKENVAQEIASGKIVPMRMTSTKAAAELAIFGDRKPDMVFIDADHRYESVAADIAAWRGLIADDGILCGHDYSKEWPGVMKAVDEQVPNRTLVAGTCLWFTIINRNAP